MGKTWDKFKLLMWKNFKLQIRHPVQSILLIIVPVIFVSQVLLFRGLVEPVEYPDGKEFKPFDVTLNRSIIRRGTKIAWSPCNNSHLLQIMKDVAMSLQGKEFCRNNATQLENSLKTNYVKTLCGVQFDDSLGNNSSLPPKLNITIRFHAELKAVNKQTLFANWHTYFLFPKMSGPGPRDPDDNNGASPIYRDEGFLAVQKQLSEHIMQYHLHKQNKQNISENYVMPLIQMQRYPYPPWIQDLLIMPLMGMTGLMLVCSFLISAICTIKMLTTEKETKIKEAMKIMGLSNWLHWTAWFVKSFILIFMSTLLVVMFFKIKFPNPNFGVLSLSNVGVLILFMAIYTCATVTLCFAVSVFFAQANTAAAVGALIWFLLYFPYGATQLDYNTLQGFEKILMCLGSNSALALAFNIILDFESQGQGIQWNNIFLSTTPEDTLTLGFIMLMLIFDTFLYLLVALYVEAIYPGEYGVPKPWYFPFMKSFWFKNPVNKKKIMIDEESFRLNPKLYEDEPRDRKVGIQIRNLGKVYSNKKMAVRDLTLNMLEDDITALLGHNGAGKTTTVSILTGMIPPSYGSAVINGYDITKDMDRARESIGLCPQYNIIFDELTVYEHIYFFGKLKGLTTKEIQREVSRYIDLLDLTEKRNVVAKHLSGGMKRKLCIAIALCGNSKIVLLDEPTAGIDPAARRAVWNILQKEKKGRTILLTTHYMDEADLLGDRIAIMADGELQSCGTSFFLKKKFGAGYHLILEKSPNCDVKKVTETLQKYIPEIAIENNVGTELSYSLNEQHLPRFEAMLRDLETNGKNLHINSFGISLTTLEEVFLKVGADKKHNYNEGNGKIMNGFHANNINNQGFHENLKYVSGCKFFWNQIFAMFFKRSLATYRSFFLFFVQLLVPIIFIIMGIITVRKTLFGKDLPNYDVSFEKYSDPITVINGSNVYKNHFEKLAGKISNVVDLNQSDIRTYILDAAKKDISRFRQRYIMGATFSKDYIKAWFNNEPYHSPPLTLQYVLNAIMQKELGDGYEINISNFPLPYTLDSKFAFLKGVGSTGLQLATNIGLSMAFVSSFYVLFYVKERISGAKHLQYVSGANVITLWAVSYIWDFILYLIICFFLLASLLAFQEDGYDTVDDMGRLLMVLAMFAFCALPMTYLASFLFTIPSSGFTFLSVFNVFTGTILFTIVKLLNSKELNLKYIGKKLHWAFLLFPHYTLSSSIHAIYLTQSQHRMCNNILDACNSQEKSIPELCQAIVCSFNKKCCDKLGRNITISDYIEWEDTGIGKHLTYSVIVGMVFIAILLMLEYNVFKWLSYYLNALCYPVKKRNLSNYEEESDVFAEKLKVHNFTNNDLKKHSLVLKDLTKYYKKQLAVNKVNLAVEKYECFGLLGTNGAGKTSTFKMITGDESISTGNAWTNGLSIKSQLKETHKIISYCPQFDALLDNLTAGEMLILYSLLRGINYKDCKRITKALARDFDFVAHLNKKISECSGGTKRKVSTAIAMVGRPFLIYLDEPTAGMDPATKRNIWNNINKARDSGKCIILTSHSMEECEALCTRIAIMVNGVFKCLGSIQHLKNKFSQGYTMTIKTKKFGEQDFVARTSRDHVEAVQNFVARHLPSAKLTEHYQELFSYYVPGSTVPLSDMFRVMEDAKRSLDIEDYFIGQCTLEQVFINLCNETCYVFE